MLEHARAVNKLGQPSLRGVHRQLLRAAMLAVVASTVVAVSWTAAGPALAAPSVVQSGESTSSFMNGPTAFSASFGIPTRPGDLLAASVICGVFEGGMTDASLSFPPGWRQAVGVVGGIEGGLEAAEFFYPNNPGGITSFGVGSVPVGTETDCTTFWSELAVSGSSVAVQASGTASTSSGSSTSIVTAGAVPAGDLVFLASTDGTEVPDNIYTLPTGFQILSQQNSDEADADQPGTFSDLTATGGSPQGGTVSWNGGSTDSVAVIAALRISTPPSATTTAPPGQGYDLVATDGGVFTFGSTQFFGSTGGTHGGAPVVGMIRDIRTGGYLMVTADGGVNPFDATPYGSLSSTPLDAPIVGAAADNVTGGYWMVASDGGVFAFNAPFYGSMGGRRLHQAIVGMAAMPFGTGYWLVARDGGVFAFGNAPFHGSTGGIHLDRPVVGMAADSVTGGYWLVASDGGVFAFDAPFLGSTGGDRLDAPVVGLATTRDAQGYWFVGSDGGVFAFGDALFEGSTGGTRLDAPIVGILPS